MQRKFFHLLLVLLGTKVEFIFAQGSTNAIESVNSGASQNTGYSFNPLGVKRDPFLPPELPSQENLREVQKFDINQMTLVAILTGIGKPQAMISLPNGKTEVISTGEVIGRRNGVVTDITPSQVKIKESFRDYQNRVKNDITTLEIAE